MKKNIYKKNAAWEKRDARDEVHACSWCTDA